MKKVASPCFTQKVIDKMQSDTWEYTKYLFELTVNLQDTDELDTMSKLNILSCEIEIMSGEDGVIVSTPSAMWGRAKGKSDFTVIGGFERSLLNMVPWYSLLGMSDKAFAMGGNGRVEFLDWNYKTLKKRSWDKTDDAKLEEWRNNAIGKPNKLFGLLEKSFLKKILIKLQRVT